MSVNNLSNLKEVKKKYNKSLVKFKGANYIYHVRAGKIGENIGKLYFYSHSNYNDENDTTNIYYYEFNGSNIKFEKEDKTYDIGLSDYDQKIIICAYTSTFNYSSIKNECYGGNIKSDYKLYFENITILDGVEINNYEVVEVQENNNYVYSFVIRFDEDNLPNNQSLFKLKIDIFRDENKERKILTHVFDVLINFQSEEPGGF